MWKVVKVVSVEFHAIIIHNYLFHDIGESGTNEGGLPQTERERHFHNITVVPFHSWKVDVLRISLG